MLLVSCDIHMQKNSNTCYMHMQEIANTCMSNNFQLLFVSSSRKGALQHHPFSLWPIFLQGRQCLISQHPFKIQNTFTLVDARVVQFLKNGQSPTPRRDRNPMQCTTLVFSSFG